jgi:acid stress-induced BolA-like protein IbaG/YrbA
MQNLCFGTECTISGYWSCEISILLHWTQLMFVSVSDHFAKLQQVKDAKLVFGDWMHCFRVLKFWSFHSTPLDTIDGCECFGSFRWPSTGKRWKTCVWVLNFTVSGYWSCEASILLHWTQSMFVSVSEHFADLQQVKVEKLVFGDWMHCFRVLKLWSIHSTPLDTIDVCECFGSFR